MNKRDRQSGFSMVELMLALGIGVLVVGAAFMAYGTRRTDAEINVMDAAVNDVVQKVNLAYATSNQYVEESIGSTGRPLGTARVADVGGLPTAFIPDASHASGFRHYWGGQASLGVSSTDGGTTRDLMTIALEDLPPRVCIDLVGRVAPRMYDTTVNGNLVGLMPERTAARQGRNHIRVAPTVALCSANDSADVVFRFLKPLDYSKFRSLPVTSTFTPAPGGSPDADEAIAITDNYNRIEAALNAREAAQLALP